MITLPDTASKRQKVPAFIGNAQQSLPGSSARALILQMPSSYQYVSGSLYQSLVMLMLSRSLRVQPLTCLEGRLLTIMPVMLDRKPSGIEQQPTDQEVPGMTKLLAPAGEYD